MALTMVEVQLDLVAFHEYLHSQGAYSSIAEVDYGYAVHQWMAAAFGECAPKPWRFFIDRKGQARILGYGDNNAATLRNHLREFALPSVTRVCPQPEVMINSKTMPRWDVGRRLGFQVLCCPVGRKAGSGVEKDLFLIRADDRTQHQREKVYGGWLKERMETGGAIVHELRLEGFRLVKQKRQTQFQPDKGRKAVSITRPHVLLEGELTIVDPDLFSQLLKKGLGRHRSFGYGMILLRPAR